MRKNQKYIIVVISVLLLVFLFIGYAFDPILSSIKYYYRSLPLYYSLSQEEATSIIQKHLSQLNINQEILQVNRHGFYSYGYEQHVALEHRDEQGHFTPLFKPWPSWSASSKDLSIVIHGDTGEVLELYNKANMNRHVSTRLTRDEMNEKAKSIMKVINNSSNLEFIGEELFLAYPDRNYNSVEYHRFTFKYKSPIKIGHTFSGRTVMVTEYEMYLLPNGEIEYVRIIWDW